MTILLTIVHVLVCFALIGIVLLQHGKGADIGAAFGGSSQTVFGSAGATTFLGKLTAGAAIVFMVTSVLLTYWAGHRYKTTIMSGRPAAKAPAAPAAPQPAAPQPAAPAPAATAPAAPAPAAPAPTK
jgi:preprotein translocase subunit SecG